LAELQVMGNVCSNNLACNKHVILYFAEVLRKTEATNNLVLLVWHCEFHQQEIIPNKALNSYGLNVCQHWQSSTGCL